MTEFTIGGWPGWLVLTGCLLAAFVVVWFLVKIVKVALWLTFWFVVGACAVAAILYVFRQDLPFR